MARPYTPDTIADRWDSSPYTGRNVALCRQSRFAQVCCAKNHSPEQRIFNPSPPPQHQWVGCG